MLARIRREPFVENSSSGVCGSLRTPAAWRSASAAGDRLVRRACCVVGRGTPRDVRATSENGAERGSNFGSHGRGRNGPGRSSMEAVGGGFSVAVSSHDGGSPTGLDVTNVHRAVPFRNAGAHDSPRYGDRPADLGIAARLSCSGWQTIARAGGGDARHRCVASVAGSRFRSDDDGVRRGSAGRAIARQLIAGPSRW